VDGERLGPITDGRGRDLLGEMGRVFLHFGDNRLEKVKARRRSESPQSRELLLDEESWPWMPRMASALTKLKPSAELGGHRARLADRAQETPPCPEQPMATLSDARPPLVPYRETRRRGKSHWSKARSVGNDAVQLDDCQAGKDLRGQSVCFLYLGDVPAGRASSASSVLGGSVGRCIGLDVERVLVG